MGVRVQFGSIAMNAALFQPNVLTDGRIGDNKRTYFYASLIISLFFQSAFLVFLMMLPSALAVRNAVPNSDAIVPIFTATLTRSDVPTMAANYPSDRSNIDKLGGSQVLRVRPRPKLRRPGSGTDVLLDITIDETKFEPGTSLETLHVHLPRPQRPIATGVFSLSSYNPGHPPKSPVQIQTGGFDGPGLGSHGAGTNHSGIQSTGFTDGYGNSGETGGNQAELVVEPVRIISKPTPMNTEDAHYFKIEGEVLVDVLFGADGKARVHRVLHGLRHGLNEEAAHAVEGILFKPASVNGQPIDFRARAHVIFQLIPESTAVVQSDGDLR